MKKVKLELVVIGLVLTCFSILLVSVDTGGSEEDERTSHLEYNTARIISIVMDNTFFPDADDPHFYGEPGEVRLGTIVYEIEVLRGSFAGLVLEAEYHMNSPADVYFQVGDRVSVRIFEFEEEINIVEIRHPERMELLLGVVAFFLLALCVIGGKRGVLAVLGLVFSVACVLLILIPLIIVGYSPLLVTFVILTLVTVATITLLAGVSAKGISAILGCLSGVALAALFAQLVGFLLKVSGYNMGNATSIMQMSDQVQVSGLFISSVLVASIGAIMDSSMSVASALDEIKLADPHISMKRLFKAGFNISRDVMGTMSNTLILAFIGGSLSMMIFMQMTNTSFNQFINHDMIVMEAVKGVAGSFGIILATPLTAFISAKLLTMKLGGFQK